MKSKQEIFSAKLSELEEEYVRLQNRIRLFQEKDERQILEELGRLQKEGRQRQRLLNDRIRSSRSPSAASLARAQLDYEKQAEKILTDKLPNEMRGTNQTWAQDQAEAMSLYAEYAIDFAVQSMRYALVAALKAIDLQMSAEENNEQKEEFNHE